MAKINIEIELDFISGEMELEDAAKEQIFSNIESRVVQNIQKKLTDEAEKKISSQIGNLVHTSINSKITEFLEKKRDITDKYGDIVKKGVTVEDMLREAVDSACEKTTLDDNGRVTNSSYNQKYSVISYFLKKNLAEMVDKKIEKETKWVKAEIESLVKNQLKGAIAENLTDFILKNSNPLIKK